MLKLTRSRTGFTVREDARSTQHNLNTMSLVDVNKILLVHTGDEEV